jgi:superfamily II DNA or RNA helicase
MDLGPEFKQFEAAVLGVSSSLDRKSLIDWVAKSRWRKPHSFKVQGERLKSHGGPRSPLRYQQEIFAGLQEAASSSRRALVGLPTGAGKTFSAVRWVLGQSAHGPGRVLWIAPQRLLLEQAAAEFRSAWYAEARGFELQLLSDIGPTIRAAEGDSGCVMFSTFQRLLGMPQEEVGSLHPQIVVVDEAHHTEANEFGRVVDLAAAGGAKVIGLSATPGRTSRGEFENLLARFGGTLVAPKSLGRTPVEALQRAGVYAAIRQEKLVGDGVRRGARPAPSGAALRTKRLDATVKRCVQLPESARVLVFCYSIAHCHVVAAALDRVGLPVAVVGSEFGDVHNKAVIEAFRLGRIRFLVNVKYVAVGADFPFADTAVLTVPLESAIQFEQVVGRIARGPAVGGTDEALLLDFDDHLSWHGEIMSYARYWEGWWSIISGASA